MHASDGDASELDRSPRKHSRRARARVWSSPVDSRVLKRWSSAVNSSESSCTRSGGYRILRTRNLESKVRLDKRTKSNKVGFSKPGLNGALLYICYTFSAANGWESCLICLLRKDARKLDWFGACSDGVILHSLCLF